MGSLTGLKPERVWFYFEEITRIPHGSGNVDRISEYLANFGYNHGLQVIRDEYNNVILIREAGKGFEDKNAVILQGHMDMVTVKTEDCPLDLQKDPLSVAVQDGYVYAQGTSLGGDDGIAVAMTLAILEDTSLVLPRIEAVFTSDEEVGMDGARQIDLSPLQGNTLINIDSEDEGVFTVGCAGGGRVSCELKLENRDATGDYVFIKLEVCNLQGGHSGIEIIKRRGNANKLMGELLLAITERIPETAICSLAGGEADNAIPRSCTAVIAIPAAELETMKTTVDDCRKRFKQELGERDPGLSVLCTETVKENHCFSAAAAAKLLCELPDGIIRMSPEIPTLVQTSLNMGMLTLTAEENQARLKAVFAVRSSVDEEKEVLIGKLKTITEKYGGSNRVAGVYPGWAYAKDSAVRDSAAALYLEMYGKQPVIEVIHAGLECGLLAAKRPGLDCISLGPDMREVHTTGEKLYIDSVARVYDFLVELLVRL